MGRNNKAPGRPKSPSRPDPIDIHVGSRLRLRRKAMGLSQTQVGTASGLTFQQIQKYENGTNRVSASRLYHFAQVLECPVEFFFGDLAPVTETEGLNGAHTGDRITDFLRTNDGVALNDAFSRISQETVRKAIIRFVRELADEEKFPS